MVVNVATIVTHLSADELSSYFVKLATDPFFDKLYTLQRLWKIALEDNMMITATGVNILFV